MEIEGGRISKRATNIQGIRNEALKRDEDTETVGRLNLKIIHSNTHNFRRS